MSIFFTAGNLLISGLICFVALFLGPGHSFASHGLNIGGELKYGPDFTHFDYVMPQAPKGGVLKLHALGDFDSLNPFAFKGTAADGLGRYVFETLTVASLDEPMSQYGLLAKDIQIAPDNLSVTFFLNPAARFSDGSPVTAEDVAFSHGLLTSKKAHPFYRIYFQDISQCTVLDTSTIRFDFQRENRELPMIIGQLPVLPKKYYQNDKNTLGTQNMPVGSGPYTVIDVQQGRSITYKRNPQYWAVDHPVRKGMYNFDTIKIEYFKDEQVSLEGLKAGVFDVMQIMMAKQWARDLHGKRFNDKELVKKSFIHENNAGMQAFVFNSRKKIFANPEVRRALGLAFDFEWTNKALFFDQYQRCTSFFSNSVYAAQGLPQGKELALLEPFRQSLPESVFTEPLRAPVTNGREGLRQNLREAKRILKKQGWTIQNRQLTNAQGDVLSFEILLAQKSFERIIAPFVENLKRLGVRVQYRTVDASLYIQRVKNFDFDMIVYTFAQSQSPGNEQRNYWSMHAAQEKGSRNLAGVSSPVVDKLVEAIVYAQSAEELIAACRALDRVLWYGYYVIPQWFLPVHRMVYAKQYRYPTNRPRYFSADQFVMTWWAMPEASEGAGVSDAATSAATSAATEQQ